LPAYLRSLYYVPLMTGDQELDAFRRYNYLKHKAARLVEALEVATVTQGQLDAVAAALRAFEALRQEIVQANLRLVVSIAKRHVGWSAGFFETVSDGNISLMRAVEKFDYSRGYKFSTYASWAIMKNFARTVPEKHYHLARFVTGQDELFERTADQREADAPQVEDQSLAEVLESSMVNLTERERTIVTNHFGLFGAATTSTLEELGRKFGVTKERIRQIERRAIGKLKAALSPGIAEMLSN
jgi:RNA polymerase sigma factor (sigma-70 family)